MNMIFGTIQNVIYGLKSEHVSLFVRSNTDVVQYVVVIYVILFMLGHEFMAKRESFKITGPVRLWNLVLAVFSMAGTLTCARMLGSLFPSRSLHEMACESNNFVIYNGNSAFWIFAFIVLKMLKLLETAFLCFQKKPFTFSHIYSRLMELFFFWHASRTLLPANILFTFLGYLMQSVISVLNLMRSCGLDNRRTLLARAITLCYSCQSYLYFGLCLYMSFHYFSADGCFVEPGILRLGLATYGVLSINITSSWFRCFMNKIPVHAEASKAVPGDVRLFPEPLTREIKLNSSIETHQTLTGVYIPFSNGVSRERKSS
ncbi:unnamed protein product [Phytomonas sp. EM1]|nr:unnamed protein product [Phytomonas sp. EM1]|eukprot:CCW62706.1 unnamed protein product [Phytomonas sp. isolate EM1]